MAPTPQPRPLPDNPSIEWLRKHAKERLAALRKTAPDAQLADAQFALATEYGFKSWRDLKARIDALGVKGRLFAAAKAGDLVTLAQLLDPQPDLLLARQAPYQWSLLHVAANEGQVEVIGMLLARGMDVDLRERGDNSTPLFWAAGSAHVDAARHLLDAGADVNASGDDHALRPIGWAVAWTDPELPQRKAMVQLLLERGAHHHIFSAIAVNDGDAVRRLVRDDPSALQQRMSRSDGNQTPLHFAVLKNRRAMVELLLSLGADPLAVDSSKMPVAGYATGGDAAEPVMRAIQSLATAEVVSADRGARRAQGTVTDLMAALALKDWPLAERLANDAPAIVRGGIIHLMAKRGDATAVEWLIARGTGVNLIWSHVGMRVTPLHLAVMSGNPETVQVLLDAGADRAIRDSMYHGDAAGWAAHFNFPDIEQQVLAHMAQQGTGTSSSLQEDSMHGKAYEVTAVHAPARGVAGVRAIVPFGRVAEYFGRNLDLVYAAGRGGAITLDGQNIFIYRAGEPGTLLVDFGVGCAKPFEPIGEVRWLETPSGLAATVTHWGDYGGIGAANEALRQWCKEQGHLLAGPSWEVYGHWNDDPTKVRTDIFYLLTS